MARKMLVHVVPGPRVEREMTVLYVEGGLGATAKHSFYGYAHAHWSLYQLGIEYCDGPIRLPYIYNKISYPKRPCIASLKLWWPGTIN